MSRRSINWKAVAVVAAAWGGLGLLASLGSYVLSFVDRPVVSPGVALARQMPRWLIWALLTPLVLWLGRKVPFDARPRWFAIAFHAVAGTGVAVVQTLATAGSFLLLMPGIADQFGVGSYLLAFLGSQVHFAVLGYGAIVGAGFAVDYHRRLRARELAAARLETELVSAQLRALQTRVHPHFLFNALHALGVLIEENPVAARRIVSHLGDLLRRVLDRTEAQEIPLADELELLDPYLEIERLRFQDRLTVAVDVQDDARSALVPVFILQPIVENAVRHGIERHAGEGRLDVRAVVQEDRLVIEVDNAAGNRDTTPPGAWREGIGLSTTRERLRMLYGRRHEVHIETRDGRTRVALRIPLRRESA